MEKYFIIINDAQEGSWPLYMWKDINNQAEVFMSSNTIKNSLLKKIYKIHFSNRINSKLWIPFKRIWNRFFIVRPESLCDGENYIIFQSNIKWSPTYISMLKNKYNIKIILYLPDTVQMLGIGANKEKFNRYISYYMVDECYSFDKNDCKKYEMKFFDMYSSDTSNEKYNEEGILYVGNCREEKRHKLLIDLLEKFNSNIKCKFYLSNVSKNNIKNDTKIIYNQYLSYEYITSLIKKSSCILEIVNSEQSGNTLRFKEAICFNKKLITNNKNVIFSEYYNPNYIYIFESIDDIDLKWILTNITVDYKYKGEFSPLKFLDIISSKYR